MKGPMKRLELNKALYARDVGSLSKFYVLERREAFRKNPPPGLDVCFLRFKYSSNL